MTSVASLPGSKTASVVRDSCFVSMTNGTIASSTGRMFVVGALTVSIFVSLPFGGNCRSAP